MRLSTFRLFRGCTYCIHNYIRLSSTAPKLNIDGGGGGVGGSVVGPTVGDIDVREDLTSVENRELDGNLNESKTASSTESAVSSSETDEKNEKGELMNARSVPRDWTSQKRLLQIEAMRQPANPKQLVAAMLGAPNSGKSTLANRLVGRKICSVSKRVDTTLHKTLAISTEGDTQLIFFDTPGIVDPFKKKHYADSLLRDPHTVLSKADVIIVVVDVSSSLARTGLHPEILKVLHLRQDKETILVLNKVDLIPAKSTLLNVIRLMTNGVVGEAKSHATSREIEEEEHRKWKERNFDPKEFVKNLIIENEATVAEDGSLVPSVNADSSERISRCSDSKEKDLVSSPSFDSTTTPTRKNIREFMRISAIPCPEKNWPEYRLYLKWLNPRLSGMTSWTQFSRVFLVSALEEDGTDDVKNFLLEAAPPGPWSFDEHVLTDQNPKEIVLMTVREKLLEFVPEDVPYNLKLHIIEWTVHELYLEIHVGVGFRRRGKAKMSRDAMFLLGRKGDAIKRVSSEARKALMDTFLCDISLKVHVKQSKS